MPSTSAARAVCYCRDCQAYARFLGTPGITDDAGGTEVVASLPKYVGFTDGVEAIACMSLSERGLLRWYARCCDTPIGNTPRSRKVPYVGVIHGCLEATAPPLDASFGPLRVAVNTGSARKAVRSTQMASTAAVLKLMSRALGDRLSGAYRHNPFFDSATGAPIRSIRVLSQTERDHVYQPTP